MPHYSFNRSISQKLGENDTLLTKIEMPENCKSIISWQVKTGSIVRAGELIAYGSSEQPCVKAKDEQKDTAEKRNQITTLKSEKKVIIDLSSDETSAKEAHEAKVQQVNENEKKIKLKEMANLPSQKNSVPRKKTSREILRERMKAKIKEKANASESSMHQDAIKICSPSNGFITIFTEVKDGNLGHIEPCKHNAILNGLCVICGLAVSSFNSSAPTEEEGKKEKASRLTIGGGYTVNISSEEAESIAQQNVSRLTSCQKLPLILDLDHTLVHATSDMRADSLFRFDPTVRSIFLPIGETSNNVNVNVVRHFVKLRPFIKEFLESVANTYEVSVYTAGTRAYALKVTNVICRYMIGMKEDEEEMINFEIEVKNLEREVQGLRKLISDEKGIDNNSNLANNEDTSIVSAPNDTTTDITSEKTSDKKRLVESSEETSTSPPAKRKKVTFSKPSIADHQTSLKNLIEKLEAVKKRQLQAQKLLQSAQILHHKLFGSRIISRTDVGDLGRDVKSLKRILPSGSGTNMAVVIDDREDVWANCSDNLTLNQNGKLKRTKGEPPLNLLLCKPFHWKKFMGFADVNVTPNQKVPTKIKEEDNELDEQLNYTTKLLSQLHKKYFQDKSDSKVSVPLLIGKMKQLILPHCKIVFSGLVPIRVQQQLQQSTTRPFVIRYAEDLGADVVTEVSSEVTHIVAAKDGTEKITTARRKFPHIKIVKLSWLMECYYFVVERDVTPHLLIPEQQSIHSSGNKSEKDASLENEEKKFDNLKTDRNIEKDISSEIFEPNTNGRRRNVLLSMNDDEDEDEDDVNFALDLEKEMMS